MSAARPGPRNALTDVPGLAVGSAQDLKARTGVTVVRCDPAAVCAVDVRGGGPGTRETDALTAHTLVERVDAIALSGGSVYGLGAGDAVVAALGAQGAGFQIAPGLKTAPIVPGAILFDLANGGDKEWGETPPYPALARAALAAAGETVALGSVGAGTGAMAGALKGGLGSASIVTEGLGPVAALAAVNAWGSVVTPGSRAFWAWPFEIDGEFGGARPDVSAPIAADDWGLAKAPAAPRMATTLAVVACALDFSPAEAHRVAIMAQDGLARAIRPVHAPYDGDVVFALATGVRPAPEPRAMAVAAVGAMAADCLARAVARGVYAATPLAGERCWRDLS